MRVLHIIDQMGLGGAQTLVAGVIEGCGVLDDIYCYVLRKNDLRLINLRNTVNRNVSSCIYDIFAIPEL